MNKIYTLCTNEEGGDWNDYTRSEVNSLMFEQENAIVAAKPGPGWIFTTRASYDSSLMGRWETFEDTKRLVLWEYRGRPDQWNDDIQEGDEIMFANEHCLMIIAKLRGTSEFAIDHFTKGLMASFPDAIRKKNDLFLNDKKFSGTTYAAMGEVVLVCSLITFSNIEAIIEHLKDSPHHQRRMNSTGIIGVNDVYPDITMQQLYDNLFEYLSKNFILMRPLNYLTG